MSRYVTYKPSGIDWIGEVPIDWKVKRVKDFFSILGGNGFPDDEQGNETGDIPFLKVSDINSDDYRVYSSSNYVSNETVLKKGWNVIPANSIVMGKIGEALKKNHRKINTVDCLIDNNMMALQPLPKVNIKFSYYLLSIVDMDWFTNPGTIPAVSTVALKSSKVTLPSPSEQLTIANYLDDQTQKIDRLIANKKAQAEKLKELRQIEINNAVTKGLNPNAEMKDSGIEWLGKIPKHWDVKHLKRAFKFFNNIRIPLSSEERADLENIYDYYGASGIIDKVDRYLFDGDFILIGEDGANLVFRSTPLAFKASGKFWVNNHAHILQPIKGDIDYNTFMLESLDYSIYISGSAQPKLTIEALSSMRVIVPPKDEQIEIANYLKERTTAIDQLIKNIEA